MDENQLLQETYRLSRENNKMLHSMRRNAFWGGLVKIVIYLALLGVPVWLYFTYMFPVIQSMQQTMNRIQGTNAQAQTQFGNFQQMWEQFQKQFGSGTSTPR